MCCRLTCDWQPCLHKTGGGTGRPLAFLIRVERRLERSLNPRRNSLEKTLSGLLIQVDDSEVQEVRAVPSFELWSDFVHCCFSSALLTTISFPTFTGFNVTLLEARDVNNLPATFTSESGDDIRFSNLLLLRRGIQDSRDGMPNPPEGIEAWKKPRGVSDGSRSQDRMECRIFLSKVLRVRLWIKPRTRVCRCLGMRKVRKTSSR